MLGPGPALLQKSHLFTHTASSEATLRSFSSVAGLLLQQPLVEELKKKAEASSLELAGAVPAQQAASLESSAG